MIEDAGCFAVLGRSHLPGEQSQPHRVQVEGRVGQTQERFQRSWRELGSREGGDEQVVVPIAKPGVVLAPSEIGRSRVGGVETEVGQVQLRRGSKTDRIEGGAPGFPGEPQNYGIRGSMGFGIKGHGSVYHSFLRKGIVLENALMRGCYHSRVFLQEMT